MTTVDRLPTNLLRRKAVVYVRQSTQSQVNRPERGTSDACQHQSQLPNRIQQFLMAFDELLKPFKLLADNLQPIAVCETV